MFTTIVSSLLIAEVRVFCSTTGARGTLDFRNRFDIASDGTTLTPRGGVTIRELSSEYPVDDFYDALRDCLPAITRHLSTGELFVEVYDIDGTLITADEIRIHRDDLDLPVYDQEIPYGLDPHNPLM